MQTVTHVADLRSAIRQWRCEGRRIAFVPTMGNLHAGHYSLIQTARANADRVVASIYVNPTQFALGEDYGNYPRTLESDQQGLREQGCDLLFAPEDADVYPPDQAGPVARIDLGELANSLCGAFRPGHFAGVAQVCARLFHFVEPDVAVFGEKDYQQLLVIRALVRAFAFPLQIIGAPTGRNEQGLALSSRNQYLTEEELQQAVGVIDALRLAVAQIQQGEVIAKIEEQGYHQLAALGFRPDYFAVRRALDLGQVGPSDKDLRVLVAARLGKARLIDNLPAVRDTDVRAN